MEAAFCLNGSCFYLFYPPAQACATVSPLLLEVTVAV
jgi:hypothetical protein